MQRLPVAFHVAGGRSGGKGYTWGAFNLSCSPCTPLVACLSSLAWSLIFPWPSASHRWSKRLLAVYCGKMTEPQGQRNNVSWRYIVINIFIATTITITLMGSLAKLSFSPIAYIWGRKCAFCWSCLINLLLRLWARSVTLPKMKRMLWDCRSYAWKTRYFLCLHGERCLIMILKILLSLFSQYTIFEFSRLDWI